MDIRSPSNNACFSIGVSILSGNCTEYQINIKESLCPPDKSGAVATYTCEMETGHGARRAQSIRVTYLRKGEGQGLETEQQLFNV